LHVSIGVPGSAALPLQRGQRSTASYCTSTDAPVAACSRVMSTATITSPPWTAPVELPKGSPAPPKNASKMSENEPKPPKFEWKPRESSPSWP
jgi:hypothetical protein